MVVKVNIAEFTDSYAEMYKYILVNGILSIEDGECPRFNVPQVAYAIHAYVDGNDGIICLNMFKIFHEFFSPKDFKFMCILLEDLFINVGSRFDNIVDNNNMFNKNAYINECTDIDTFAERMFNSYCGEFVSGYKI